MAKFNGKERKVLTEEGALAYEKDAVDDFVNNLFSNFLDDGFYKTGKQNIDRMIELVDAVRSERGDAFVAKLAKFSRNELGMRSAAQLVAGCLNDSKMESKREFFREFCHRPDDVAEVFGFIQSRGMKPSHAMVRGFGDYISGLSEYSIGKYKMSKHDWNMYDIINVTHAHSDAIDKFKMDILKPPDTWEVSISGSKSESEKADNWIRLVEEHKLGYNALIMNLRNILASANDSRWWVRDVLCPQITDANAIRSSLVFPYKIYNAYINYRTFIANDDVDYALSSAFMESCANVPKFDGKTAVVVDVSGSMDSAYSEMSSLSISEISACYAAAFLISNAENTVVYKFGTDAERFEFSGVESAFSLISKLRNNDGLGYGTNISSVYDIMDEHYDRIILFSDMQVMECNSFGRWSDKHTYAGDLHREYCERYGLCRVHSFDLGNYKSQAVSDDPSVIRYFSSLSPKVFDFLRIVESGQSIADYIDSNY